MIIHKESHTDHAITQAQWHHILDVFESRTGFFIETIELPRGLGTVMNGLYGPSCGDAPVLDGQVYYAPRGDRAWNSRMVKLPTRPTRFVRVIAGPHEEKCKCTEPNPIGAPFAVESCGCDGSGVIKHACILYTAYGVSSKDMPAAPKEPGDIRKQLEELEAKRRELSYRGEEHDKVYTQVVALREKRAEADAFWAVHALAVEVA